MLDTAQYAVDHFNELGIPAWRNKNSVTVVFPKPAPEIVAKWQLASYEDIAHIIAMQHITKDTIHQIAQDCLNHSLAQTA